MVTSWDPLSKEDEARLEKSLAKTREERQKLDQEVLAEYRPQEPGTQDNAWAEFVNPYLMLGFWEFAILGTLMSVFFPWSLLFCVVFYGLEKTKLIVQALVHDAVKTLIFILIAIVSVVVSLFVFFGAIAFLLSYFE